MLGNTMKAPFMMSQSAYFSEVLLRENTEAAKGGKG